MFHLLSNHFLIHGVSKLFYPFIPFYTLLYSFLIPCYKYSYIFEYLNLCFQILIFVFDLCPFSVSEYLNVLIWLFIFCTLLYLLISFYTLLYPSIPFYTLLYPFIPFSTLLYPFILIYTFLYPFIPFYTLLYTFMHFYTLLYPYIPFYSIWYGMTPFDSISSHLISYHPILPQFGTIHHNSIPFSFAIAT